MRNLFLALSLIAGASPAAAQQTAPVRPSAADAARLLANPMAQDLIARQIASLAGVVLDTKVGPLAALTDPRDHVLPDDTLHTVEQRRDPEFDRHMYEDTRHAVATAGIVANGAVTEAAELRRTADRLRVALGPIIGAAKALSQDQRPPAAGREPAVR